VPSQFLFLLEQVRNNAVLLLYCIDLYSSLSFFKPTLSHTLFVVYQITRGEAMFQLPLAAVIKADFITHDLLRSDILVTFC
jgi:hypothetical protein